MRSLLRRIPLFALGIAFVSAEPPGIDQSLEFVTPPTGAMFIRWHGKPGRSYFVQISDPANHLNTWHFATIIEAGNDHDISYQVDGTADKGFLRLKYTDQVPGPGETLDTADFDGDGISNWDELNIYHTDPLNPDTDGDGIPDGWEIAHGLNPNNSSDAANLFPGSNFTNLQAFNSGVQANPNATPTDKDGDGVADIVDADPGDKYVDWKPGAEANYAIVELEQESYGVPSANSVETKVTRKASIGKNGLVLYDVSVSHKEPDGDNFKTVSTRTARVWRNGTWSTDLSEQITPKYDSSGAIHKFLNPQVCGDYVIGNVDYSHDSDTFDPKTGGTRWNLEPTNGTTTRVYSPADVSGSGNPVEGYCDHVATSPGGAFALVSGTCYNSAIAKWRGWFPPAVNTTPPYIPGAGTSNIQISNDGNILEAIEDGGSMVLTKYGESGGTFISDSGAEFALPGDSYTATHYCICRVAKGTSGDSRLVVAATKIIPNGDDCENGNSRLWIKTGSEVHAAEYTPTIGRIKAIAKNGVILGKGAIWRNGNSVALDKLVEDQKVSESSSLSRFTNLEGLAMNGEGAIVATADDGLNPGAGRKTLLMLVPVELITDLNNDGQINAADTPLRNAALASDADDATKDRGTEFMFHNDQLSNGLWDKEDTDPSKPATENVDDDAEQITINPGITEGEVWLDHPAIAGLSFYKTRECNTADKVSLRSDNKFSVSSSNPFPNKLFMRADGIIDYPTDNPQVEGDLVLKIKIGTGGPEIEASRIKLTLVKEFGAKKFFYAARNYILRNNTKVYTCNKTYNALNKNRIYRIVVMRE